MPNCPPGETYNRTLKACRTQKKRGRKPKSATRKCPQGETYNRSIKACRTQKKRGRKAKSASPAIPMPPMPRNKTPTAARASFPSLPRSKSASPKRITFTMSAGPREATPKQIIDWYQPFFGDFDMGTKPSMTHDKKTGLFEVSFTPGPEFPTEPKDQLFELEMFADPDDDGNYPIKIGKKKYLVIGEIVSLNGVKV
jgi:hypothetical protein